MKHENNFLLYSIASAFLLVSSTMLISVSDYSHVNIKSQVSISVSAIVPDRSLQEINTNASSISGRVYFDTNKSFSFDIEDQGLPGVLLVLFKQGEDSLNKKFMTAAITDESGRYSFGNLPLGLYSIRIDNKKDFNVEVPPPIMEHFSGAWNFLDVEVGDEDFSYEGLDFLLSPVNF